MEKGGWDLLCEHKPIGFAAVVRECEHGGEERKNVLCQSKVNLLRQEGDKQNIQSEGDYEWID